MEPLDDIKQSKRHKKYFQGALFPIEVKQMLNMFSGLITVNTVCSTFSHLAKNEIIRLKFSLLNHWR